MERVNLLQAIENKDQYAVTRLLQGSPELAGTSCNAKGDSPLHIACDSTRSPHPKIASLILASCPSAVNAENNDGVTPLQKLLLCDNQTGFGSVIVQAVDHYPDVLMKKRNSDGNLPIHDVCATRVGYADPSLVLKFIQMSPEALRVGSKNGNLPIHEAVRSFQPMSVIKLLTDAYPEGLAVKNNDGALPIHLRAHAHRDEKVFVHLAQLCPQSAVAPPPGTSTEDQKVCPLAAFLWRHGRLDDSRTLDADKILSGLEQEFSMNNSLIKVKDQYISELETRCGVKTQEVADWKEKFESTKVSGYSLKESIKVKDQRISELETRCGVKAQEVADWKDKFESTKLSLDSAVDLLHEVIPVEFLLKKKHLTSFSLEYLKKIATVWKRYLDSKRNKPMTCMEESFFRVVLSSASISKEELIDCMEPLYQEIKRIRNDAGSTSAAEDEDIKIATADHTDRPDRSDQPRKKPRVSM